MKKMVWIVVLGMALSGCGDDGEGGGGPLGSDFRGVYELTEWVVNDSSCEEPTTSMLENNSKFMLVQGCSITLFGVQTYLHAAECSDADACEEQRCMKDELLLGGFSFEGGSDSAGWTGRSTSAFSSGSEGECMGIVTTFTLSGGEDDEQLQLTLEERSVSGFPRDADDFCDLEIAEKLAEDAPCSRIERRTMKRVSD